MSCKIGLVGNIKLINHIWSALDRLDVMSDCIRILKTLTNTVPPLLTDTQITEIML